MKGWHAYQPIIIVLYKDNAVISKVIFKIDAGKRCIKDGNKKRLRKQEMYFIMNLSNKQKETEKYARFVCMEQIEKNEYNLGIPLYIAIQNEEACALLLQLEKLFEKWTHQVKKWEVKDAKQDMQAIKQSAKLSEGETKQPLKKKKWMASLQGRIQSKMDIFSLCRTARIKEVGVCFSETLGTLDKDSKEPKEKVRAHFKKTE